MAFRDVSERMERNTEKLNSICFILSDNTSSNLYFGRKVFCARVVLCLQAAFQLLDSYKAVLCLNNQLICFQFRL